MYNFKTFFENYLLLEAKAPEAYLDELFGSFYKLFDEYQEDIKLAPQIDHYLENSKNIIESSFGYLKSADRINFFAPFFMFSLLNKVGGYVDVINPKSDFTKKLRRIDNKNMKKIDEGSRTNMSINVIADTIKHYFRDQTNIQTIQAYTFGNKPKNYEDRLTDLKNLENKFNEKAGKVLNPAQDDPDGAELLHQMVDSKKVYFEWVNLNTANCPTKEAQLMDHCGASERADTMFSLRRPFNKQELTNFGISQKEGKSLRKPVITFAIAEEDDGHTLVESHGISNSKPQEEFHEAIVSLFEAGHINKINQRGAYKPETTFKLDDLSDELRAKIPDTVEEESQPTFTEEEIENIEGQIKQADLPEGVHVYAEEDTDMDREYVEEYGVPYRIEWGFEFDLSSFNLNLPAKQWYDIKSDLNIVDAAEWDSGWSNGSEDKLTLQVRSNESKTTYPSEDNLYYEVDSAIDEVKESYDEFLKENLNLIISKYGPRLTPEIEEFFENFKDNVGDQDIEVANTENGLIYKHTLTTFLRGRKLPNKEQLTNWIRKWNKDGTFEQMLPKSVNKNDFDRNQTEFDFSERSVSEEQTRFNSVIDNILLEAIRKPKGRNWVIKLGSGGDNIDFVCYLDMDLKDQETTSQIINQIKYVDDNKHEIANDLLKIIETPELGKTTSRQARERRV